MLIAQTERKKSAEELAAAFVNAEKDVPDALTALSMARDILAEQFSDDAAVRGRLRTLVTRTGIVRTKAAKEEDSVYRMYYDFTDTVAKIPGHRVLAINRGEREEFLRVSIECEDAAALMILSSTFVRMGSTTTEQVRMATQDAWERLIFPAIEREVRTALTDAAGESAIRVFSDNLHQLLMQPPVKGRVTLGVDPGFRTGCKLAVVDESGKVLETGVGHFTLPGAQYRIVSEAGASVYSASKLAAEEFPEYDVNLRSAVSIARRLQDPLAELVKIEPKAIGVGQYQHDMPQARLEETLGGVVEDCVNAVGADVNTASPALLTYISGLNKTTAKNIVLYREANGIFSTRKELLKVPKLGPKAFEQCAGFLRVPESTNALDRTGVHPESYKAAEALLKACGFTAKDVGTEKITALADAVKGREQELAEACGVGVPTLQDIVKELLKPGRDPRDELPKPILRTDVMELSDLKPGMILSGTVRNVIDFGAFVDIGVHQDGLVHTSQICDKFIRHPSEAVSVGDVVQVIVLEVDAKRKRISLSMKQAKGKTQ